MQNVENEQGLNTIVLSIFGQTYNYVGNNDVIEWPNEHIIK